MPIEQELSQLYLTGMNFLARFARRFPSFPGRWRLVRFLRNHHRDLRKLPPARFYFGGQVLEVPASTNLEVFVNGFSNAGHDLGAIACLLRPGDTVLDVGANIGTHAVRFAQMVGAHGVVHAFEPTPQVVTWLKRNVKINGCPNVVIHEKAVADKAGDLLFHVPPEDSPLASLRPLKQAETLELKVPAIALDSLLSELPKVSLVKIDVEGAEGLVLRGMARLIQRDKPTLAMELTDVWLREFGHSAGGMLAQLSTLGYKVYVPAESGVRRLEAVPDSQVDILCVARADQLEALNDWARSRGGTPT